MYNAVHMHIDQVKVLHPIRHKLVILETFFRTIVGLVLKTKQNQAIQQCKLFRANGENT